MVIYSKNEEGKVFVHAIQVNESGRKEISNAVFAFVYLFRK
jgi:hypothetical protein